ncbi:MAG: hypothetical protein V3S55_06165 [Nitrospiraceae bacterium]
MPNTPSSRPDVSGIASQWNHWLAGGGEGQFREMKKDLYTLITWIEALEEAASAVLAETDFFISPATGKPLVSSRDRHAPALHRLQSTLAGGRVQDLAARGDGDG